jgi:hypothetical protein
MLGLLTSGTRVRWCETLHCTYRTASGFPNHKILQNKFLLHTRKSEKIKSPTPDVYFVPPPISFCSKELKMTWLNVLWPSYVAQPFIAIHAYMLFVFINGIQFYEKVNYFVLDLIRLCIHCNTGVNSFNTVRKMSNIVLGI